jgi:hypothetical protein
MDTEPTGDESAAEYYRALLRPVFGARRWIVIGGPIVGLAGLAVQLRTLGAERPFLLGTIRGVGELPEMDAAEWRALDVRGPDVIAAFRLYEARLAEPPAEIQAALDAWDPEHRARAFGLIVLGDLPRVAGRARYGGRQPGWARLEDKVEIDAFWDAVGIRRAPSAIVPMQREALEAAQRDIDAGSGTVWAGDAREGLHGGGVYARWVTSRAEAQEAETFFAAHCDRVRVMPFLEGIPCSIHGVVFPEGVAAFRPVELVTLRGRSPRRLVYSGVNTYWDPPAADREAMRALARLTGEALRARLDYRGPFTVDGVMTAEGFLPTELNTRVGAGLNRIGGAIPKLPLGLLGIAAQAGETLDYRPAWLEETVVAAADASRGGGGWTGFPRTDPPSESHPLVAECDGYRRARPEEEPDGLLSTGAGDVGGFVMFNPVPERTPHGPSLAPRVARAFEWAAQNLEIPVGGLGAARPCR